jgi:hypothetical protein
MTSSDSETSCYRDYAQQLLSGGSPFQVPPDEIHPTVDYLQSLLIDCISSQNYLEAQKIEDICTLLLQQNTEQTYESHKKMRFRQLEERLIAALKSVDAARQTLHNAQTQLEQERSESLSNLCSEHLRELSDFDKSHCQEMPLAFRKFSSQYLLLKKRQEVCVQSKRFAEANSLKVEADRIEVNETARQEANWLKSVSLQREALIQRQMQQIRVFEEKFQSRWSEVILPLLNQVNRAENAVKAAELKLSTLQIGERAPMKSFLTMNGRVNVPGIGIRMRTMNYALKMANVRCKPVRRLCVAL